MVCSSGFATLELVSCSDKEGLIGEKFGGKNKEEKMTVYCRKKKITGWPRRSAKEGHQRAVFQEYINNTAVKAHPRGRRAQAEPIKLISDKFASHHRNFQCFSDRGGRKNEKKKDQRMWKHSLV